MRILVVGAGQMGSGIAQVAAQAGLEVLLNDRDTKFIERGIRSIERNLDNAVERGRITPADRGKVLSHIDPRPHFTDIDVDIAIEAATENLEVKLEIFRLLNDSTAPETILASNTSSISITKLAAVVDHPGRVIGMHFMNPVPVMRLVEVIRAIQTTDATAKFVHDLALALGKTPVESRDFPGFIANRILMPLINEAVFALFQGVGSVEAIDTVAKLGLNHPMGPLELADLIGLDTCLAIMEVLHDGLGDPKYAPCALLRQYVDAGWYGRKSGRGFYRYENGRKVASEAAAGAAVGV
jgi:3-hydroxybutyryl-CoA dehydrogenase